MASSRRVPTVENVSTYGSTGDEDYAALTTWEQATDIDMVTATQGETLECDADEDYDDYVVLDLPGGVGDSDADYFRVIRPASGAFHGGTPSTGVVFASTTAAHGLWIQEEYASIQDITVKITINNAGTFACFGIGAAGPLGNNADIVGCMAFGSTNAGAGVIHGFDHSTVTTSGFVNCAAIKNDGHGFNNTSGTLYWYNCTSVENGDDGFYTTAGQTSNATNCLSYGNTNEDWDDDGTVNKTTCSTEGDTFIGFEDPDETNYDYHLGHRGGMGYCFGTDLSADGTFAFDDDIDGTTRVNWSMGFHDYQGSFSSRRTGANETVATYGYGKTYTALATWEEATDLDLAGTTFDSKVLECYDTHAHGDYDVLDGATTSASYFRIIRPAGTIGESDWEGHDGTPTTGVTFASTADDHVFWIAEDYTQIQDIIVTRTVNNSNNRHGIGIGNTGPLGTNAWVVGCIAYDCSNAGSGLSNGFSWWTPTSGGFVNCLSTNNKTDGLSNVLGTARVYNCTVEGNDRYGIAATNGETVIAKNCIASGNGDDWDDAGGTGTLILTTNTAEGNSVTFEDSANNDFHLPAGPIRGTDLSQDSVYAFDDDIDGDTRTKWWSLGFHEALGSRHIGVNEQITTYDSDGAEGKDYSVLATWEAATDTDHVVDKETDVLECYSSQNHDDNVTLNLPGGAGDNSSSYFRIIRPATGEGHNGTVSTGVTFDETDNAGCIYIDEPYSQIQDLIGRSNASSAADTAVFKLLEDHAAAIGCIVFDSENTHASYITDGIVGDAGKTVYAVNCLVYDLTDRVGFSAWSASTKLYVYNCVSVDNNWGMWGSAINDGYFKNCIFVSNTTADWGGTAETLITCTAEGYTGVNFANSGADDFHLATGAIVGTDLSTDANYPFDDDIDGNKRPTCTRTVWSVGMHQPLSSRLVSLNEVVSTYDSGGSKTYSTLQAWEAATDNDLVTAKAGQTLECYDSQDHEDEDELDGATTSANYFRVVRPAAGEGHDGTPTTGVCFQADSHFVLGENYSQFQDLIATVTASITGRGTFVIGTDGAYSACVGCIAHESAYPSANIYGFYLINATPGYFINCLANEIGAGVGNTGHQGIRMDGQVGYAYNCTVISSGHNIVSATSGSPKYVNCVSYDANHDDYIAGGTATPTYEYCAGDDLTVDNEWATTIMVERGKCTATTANKCVDANALFITRGVKVGMRIKNITDTTWANVTAVDSETTLSVDSDIFADTEMYEIGSVSISRTFTFKDSGNDDFHLGAADTGAKGKGTDLSKDSEYAFNDDIDVSGGAGGSIPGETRA
jgi:hypothetical protein